MPSKSCNAETALKIYEHKKKQNTLLSYANLFSLYNITFSPKSYNYYFFFVNIS
jgi:hypothetical protein